MSGDLRLVVCVACLLGTSALAAEARQPASAALSSLSRAVVCAPSSPLVQPPSSMRILGAPETRRTLFGPGDIVTIAGETRQAVRTGEEYVVRRVVKDRYAEKVRGVVPISVQTAGAVQIVEARAGVSVAVVTLGCDGIGEGDYLERFEAPILPEQALGNTPDFAAPARVMLGAERRRLGAPGDFMVLDRGSDHGLRAGQLLTVFRLPAGAAGPVATIGAAKVYLVRPASSTIRIERSVDAVYVGDLVAVHR